MAVLRIAVAAGVAALAFTTVPAFAAEPEIAFRITDPRITEASGIAVGRTTPGVVYVQNDSGDSNRFFAINRSTGRTAATVTVPGAENVDWEDLAVAPDGPDGRSAVWIGDIGANSRRDEIRVYRVPEPRLDADADDAQVQAGDLAVWRLRYPGGTQHNAESLAVDPAGRAYVITKAFSGRSIVFRLPERPDADRVQTLEQVATIRFGLTGSTNPFGPAGQLTATGAAFSRDGRLLVVRTYADAFVWRIRGGDVAASLRTRPGRVAMPGDRMGEGVTFADGRLLVDSEGLDQPVYAIDVPALPGRGTPTSASPSDSRLPSVAVSPGPGAEDGSPATTVAILFGAAAGTVVVVLVIRLGVARAARRRAGRTVADPPSSDRMGP